jgi:hypothetical protein
VEVTKAIEAWEKAMEVICGRMRKMQQDGWAKVDKYKHISLVSN